MSINVTINRAYDNATTFNVHYEPHVGNAESRLLEIFSNIENSRLGDFYFFPLCEIKISSEEAYHIDIRFALSPDYKNPRKALLEILNVEFNILFGSGFNTEKSDFTRINTITDKVIRYAIYGRYMNYT